MPRSEREEELRGVRAVPGDAEGRGGSSGGDGEGWRGPLRAAWLPDGVPVLCEIYAMAKVAMRCAWEATRMSVGLARSRGVEGDRKEGARWSTLPGRDGERRRHPRGVRARGGAAWRRSGSRGVGGGRGGGGELYRRGPGANGEGDRRP